MLTKEELLSAFNLIKSKDEDTSNLGCNIVSTELKCDSLEEFMKIDNLSDYNKAVYGVSALIPCRNWYRHSFITYEQYLRLILWNKYHIEIVYNSRTKSYKMY